MIDTSIAKATAFATKKYGDTPTDALQLVPKKYVTSVVAGITAGSPGGSSGNIQYNNGAGGFAGSSTLSLIPVVPEVLLQGANPLFEALGTSEPGFSAGTTSKSTTIGYGQAGLNGFVTGVAPAAPFLEFQDISSGTKKIVTFFVTGGTTNATPGTLFEFQWPLTINVTRITAFVEAKISGSRTGGSGGSIGDAGMYIRRAGFSRAVGSGTNQVGATQDSFTVESNVAWDVTIALNGTLDIDVNVTGDVNNNIDWAGEITLMLSY